VSEALYECVVFVRLESWAVLGNNLVKALDAAVTHSLMGVKGIMQNQKMIYTGMCWILVSHSEHVGPRT
jgi:hypothetical protein